MDASRRTHERRLAERTNAAGCRVRDHHLWNTTKTAATISAKPAA